MPNDSAVHRILLNVRATQPLALLLLLGCVTQAPVRSTLEPWESVVSRAHSEVITVDSLVVDSIDIGNPGLHESRFGARLRNLSHSAKRLGLDLRTIPGLWLSAAWQGQSAFHLAPGESLRVSQPFHFRRLTPEAVLRVQLGPVQVTQSGGISVAPVLAERRYQVGIGNPDAKDPRQSFELVPTPHFDIYVYRGSLAQSRVTEIAKEREAGARQIEGLLSVRMPDRVRLVFYPDSASKTSETGHIGEGFAANGNIVEIYNDSVQLDPYHEVAHIVAGELGDPPALFDEGFAVYVSERLGAPALRYLGHQDAKVDESVCRMAKANELIPLSRLLGFTEIGSTASRSSVSYPESASIVKYLIEFRGLRRFRELYRTLKRSDAADQVRRNEEAFARILGEPLASFEARWRQALACQG